MDSVEERLVDNAAILGVVSLLTGLLFILDLLTASKRRKKSKIVIVKKVGYDKNTQTEATKVAEIRRSSDMNGNVHSGNMQNGNAFNGHVLDGTAPPDQFPKVGSKKIPKNAVKILPSSPMMEDSFRIPVTNSNNEYVGTIASPILSPADLKTSEAKIRSTESFLRSEKGEMPIIRRSPNEDRLDSQVFIPPGYVLVPAGQFDRKPQSKNDAGSDGSTPPGYAKIIVDNKTPKNQPGYVIVPVEPGKDELRRLQSPTVTTTVKTQQGYYYSDPRMQRLSLSDGESDLEESYKSSGKNKKYGKYSPEYLQMDSKGRKHSPVSDDSAEPARVHAMSEIPFRPDSRHSSRSEGKHWGLAQKGKLNRAYEDEVDFASPFQRNSSYRSSRTAPEKPKSILRFDHLRSAKKDSDLNFPKDVHYDSLDSQKIAEDLKHFKEITKSDVDLARDLEKENQILKEHLRKEKEEREKLQKDFRIEMRNKEEETKSKMEMEERKKLEERVSELEGLRKQLKLEKNMRDFELREKLEEKIREMEDEKDRRMSEREEQYFGIADLKQSQKDSSPVAHPKKVEAEGAKEVNAKLKEKFIEREDKAKEDQELRKILEEGFYFLDEEEKKRRSGQMKLTQKRSAPDLTGIYQKSVDAFQKPKISEKRWKTVETPSPVQRSDESDETHYSHMTDEDGQAGSASYKSEAQFWLGGSTTPTPTPTSPKDPGYVLHTAQNWPESVSPSPHDRFHFSSKKAQKIRVGSPSETPSPDQGKTSPEFDDVDEQKKSSHKSQLLEYEETPDTAEKVQGRRKGLLIRKVDFPEEPVTEIRRPVSVTGGTSSWKKWLQPKPKLQPTRSTPN